MAERKIIVPADELLEYALGGFQGPNGSELDAHFDVASEVLLSDEQFTNPIFEGWRKKGANVAVEELSMRICMLLSGFYRKHLCDSAMFDFEYPEQAEGEVSLIKAFGFFNPYRSYAERPSFTFRVPSFKEMENELANQEEYYDYCNTLLLAFLLAYKRYYHLLTAKVYKHRDVNFKSRYVDLWKSFIDFPQTIALGDWGDWETNYWGGQLSVFMDEEKFVENYGKERSSMSRALEQTNQLEDRQRRDTPAKMRELLWIQKDGIINPEDRIAEMELVRFDPELQPAQRKGLLDLLLGR
ncbi:MAG: hypothetical protein FWE41_05865 [Coriobacteriia bacterium]|nr:hypothetical protein [Coriobacteriia bacterium]MCL2749880.1 hypothetical protein [Coriobacteriia bacterium]